MVNVFAVPIFFICFRECLETSIIVSVLLAFLKQTLGPEQDKTTYKRLVKQVWWGTALGLIICLCIGAGMIGAFYGFGKDHFANTEDIWEGTFGIIASLIISAMGAALLRVSKLQDKWRVKLAKALESKEVKKAGSGHRIKRWAALKRWAEKYAMFMLPFVTVLREGLEAIVFIGGVGLGLPATAFPIPVITGLMAGAAVGYLIYKGGNFASIQVFLIVSTCFLYLVAAGLFSKAIWYFQNNNWNKIVGGDAAEVGNGPGSYDIRQSVWHVNCCGPEINGGGGWGVFNALFGWQNSATYGSVISYNIYWIVIIVCFLAMRYNEKKGHWPFLKPKKNLDVEECDDAASGSRAETVEVDVEKKDHAADRATSTNVRTIEG
ncbi:plasma membrane iron permease [Xylona heveae TC161]|uniref:Plasma membrane iron permease n=1 Tax=Xylona heveae (strain CBS 132557 / TC161) TaxID=1328760 RepID=A0A161TP78_XYLHT|nr:plasma membrane iron permease [Xylona heveae TC161]KZF23936.1 plasma membrane iron permease [Xylona heveae TC161]